MEGVPPPPRVVSRGPGHGALEWVGERLPGFAVAALLATLADALANWIGTGLLGYRVSPLSGVPLAILFGIIICNAAGVPGIYQTGLRLCMRQIQRIAIALLGFRLSLGAVGAIGGRALPVVVICIVVALLLIPWLGTRVGLSRRLATLIAVGTSICGVSAIMAVAPTIDAEEEEISYAVACVVIFGLLAMLTYPYIVPLLFGLDHAAVGIFLGTAIHDTAQVTGAALVYQQLHLAPDVLNTATVVKIIRNLSMVAVIPIMAAAFHRRPSSGQSLLQRTLQVVPLFVIGFLVLTVVRTIGDASARPFGVVEPGRWREFLHAMDWLSTWSLTVVMAAIGLSTNLTQLRRLGFRPFLLGLSGALILGAVSFGLIHLRRLIGL